MSPGKRKWHNWTLPWTRYHSWWTVMTHLWCDWCCREALESVCGFSQLNLNVFFHVILELFFYCTAGQCGNFISFHHKVTSHQYLVLIERIRSRVQKFPAWHTKSAPNGKCCEGYIVPSMVRLLYQFQSATCSSILEALVLVGRVAPSYCNVENRVPRGNQFPQ